MAITYKVAEARAINGATQALYTVPSDKTAIIMSAIADNSDTVSRNITSFEINTTSVYVREKVIQPGAGGAIINEIEGLVLEADDVLTVSSTTPSNNVSVRLSIKEIDNV